MPQDVDTLSAASVGSAMRYASVCDGIGAAHVAWQPLGWQCQWTSEIEPFPAAVVEHHYGFRNLGDMTAITEEMLNAPVELLVGGTPCQSFSVAGLRGGLADPRGNLALRFVQLAAVMQPKWIVWENVPGVLSSGKGRDFGTFLGALGELGYGFAYRILDAQWFGVAQRRRRVFVVGYLGDWRRAAAVLFERESVFGNPPTRGAAGQGITSSPEGIAGNVSSKWAKGTGGPAGDECYNLVAEPHAIYSNESRCDNIPPAGLSPPLKIGSDGGGNPPCIAFKPSHFTRGKDGAPADVVAPLSADADKGDQDTVLAVPFTKSKRAQSTSDDETWVPGEVSPTMSCFDQGDTRATTVVALQDCGGRDKRQNGRGWNGDGTAYTVDAAATQGVAMAFKPGQSEAAGGTFVTEEFAPTIQAQNNGSTAVPAVAFRENQRGEVAYVDPPHALVSGGGKPGQGYCGVQQAMAVRRLTPRECERLQGFPDDYTLVEYRKKPAADGPRYRALGNSMAVPVMRWIGERIQQVDRL